MRSFFRRHLSTIFELIAFVAVAVLLAHLFGFWWALLPAAVYLFFLSWSLDRGKR